jgi:FKBP-type peptidyl-prolyl cis-trans isomerase
MRKNWMNVLTILVVGLLAAAAGCKTANKSVSTPAVTTQKATVATPAPGIQPSMELKTPMDKMSYSLGVETIKNLKKQRIEINADAMSQGMKDATAGDKFLMDGEDLQTNYAMFQSLVRGNQNRARINLAQDNKKEGEEFLAANKTRQGVVTLPSGLQYKILKEGTGPRPTVTDTIQCYYRGTLIDGTEFDSSTQKVWDQGFPANVSLSDCIAGWREAIPMMPVGSKWQLFIPSNLAYGQHASGKFIGPNATLIFEVELVGIK